ncbi:alternative NAD(P)H-ubiquinone oxidoreductase C1, chloroplastic/mitochondrial isoform X1 [Abrus precatorius]|uniref:demethylphylloquinone reductase n=1 Tax=Abrus precatorius TaxID=3816 RepID=A0A8B8KD58_ABRPR|nr:alternative NAD(P)H-ubiquinone oxidoreductase C1, chloroplastic/mitochondrial isoform X1 [Abrus precatorius]XP_027341716.1 alternative NAD(P)H-ubiquinone oxidoreductase C1, chloroplastic/mitochondrial isoform X1 [Abrus precatorius]
MSHIALTASATLSAVAFHRRAKRWSTLFPSFRRCRGTGSSLYANSSRKRLQLRFFASGRSSGNGGVAEEISEAEKETTNFVWPDSKKPRVCILGGGFGGLYTALRLESLEWPEDKKPQIVLVDQSERFVFKPMLYELLSGEVDEWEIAPRFSDLLANTSVLFFKDRVKFLLPSDHWGMNGSKTSSCGGTVHLESGLLIEYDWLVLALGAEAKLDVVPGAAEFAIPFSTLEDARKVNYKLTALERKTFGKDFQISVAVVGCGYSGVELAATLAERLHNRGIVRAINVETMICPNAPPGNREAALKVLSSRKVELLLGYFVRGIQRLSELESSEVVPDTEKYILELQPAERGMQNKIIEADLVLWTVGTKPPLPQLEPSDVPFVIPLNARGQAETDETLRVKGHPRIFALGDSSALRDSNGRILPATAQVAFQQADFTGWNLWAAINGRPLLPFRFQNLGEMMTLGRNDATVSPSFVEGLTLEGSIGHAARKIAYLIRLPTDEHRLKVGISWLTKSAIDSVSSLQSTVYKVLSGS